MPATKGAKDALRTQIKELEAKLADSEARDDKVKHLEEEVKRLNEDLQYQKADNLQLQRHLSHADSIRDELICKIDSLREQLSEQTRQTSKANIEINALLISQAENFAPPPPSTPPPPQPPSAEPSTSSTKKNRNTSTENLVCQFCKNATVKRGITTPNSMCTHQSKCKMNPKNLKKTTTTTASTTTTTTTTSTTDSAASAPTQTSESEEAQVEEEVRDSPILEASPVY